jgi:recombination protein RecA
LKKEKEKLTLAEKKKRAEMAVDKLNEEKIVAFFADSKEPKAKAFMNTEYIPTPSIELNEIISGVPGKGGFPKGKMTIVVGQPDSGKTGLILETIGKYMNSPEGAEAVVLWIESEQSLDEKAMKNMYRIDMSRIVILKTEANEGGEAVLDRAEAMLNTGAFDIIVINSLKALTPKAVIDKSVSEDTIGVYARMNSKMWAKFYSLIGELNIAMIVVCHLTTQIGTYGGDPMVMSGGQAIRFGSILQLDLRKTSIQESDPIKKTEGMKITVYIRKNHCNQTDFPYGKVTYYVIYGEGTETKLALMQKGLENGTFRKAGAWIYFKETPTSEELSWCGKQALREAMDDPELYAKVEKAVGGIQGELTQEEVEEFIAEEKADEAAMAAVKKRGRKKADA